APRLGALQAELLDAGRAVEIRTFHAWFAPLLRAAPLDVLASIGLDAGRELIEDETAPEPDLMRRFHAALLDDAAPRDEHRALLADALAAPACRDALDLARKALLTGGGVPRAHLAAPALDDALRLLDSIGDDVAQHDARQAHLRMARLARMLFAEYAALKRER